MNEEARRAIERVGYPDELLQHPDPGGLPVGLGLSPEVVGVLQSIIEERA